MTKKHKDIKTAYKHQPRLIRCFSPARIPGVSMMLMLSSTGFGIWAHTNLTKRIRHFKKRHYQRKTSMFYKSCDLYPAKEFPSSPLNLIIPYLSFSVTQSVLFIFLYVFHLCANPTDLAVWYDLHVFSIPAHFSHTIFKLQLVRSPYIFFSLPHQFSRMSAITFSLRAAIFTPANLSRFR